MDAARLRRKIVGEARDLGFSDCRFTPALLPAVTEERLRVAINDGHHATMDWLLRTKERRASPQAMWPEARTAIMLAMNYGPDADPLQSLEYRECGTISVYARNRDYHELIKGRLKQIAGRIAAWTGAEVKVFVDTAPLMEKPLAQRAGIGWQGKHTNLVSRQHGSWTFLGSILTAVDLGQDMPHEDHCGNCRACLDICPTNAFPAPYRLDARRCISYLTIEHHGPIPREFRASMANRIFGCDDCLAVCPWNKFAQATAEMKLAARDDLITPRLDFLVSLDDTGFRQFFSGSPVKRIGRSRFIRNVLIAIGNSGEPALIPAAGAQLGDNDAVVRGAAVWALSRLLEPDAFAALAAQQGDTDESVAEEYRLAATEVMD
ncbi:MAG: tRNA epoxyqueuosine(34) reductase QueG [Rhizobiaceae bacterium]